MYAVTAQALEIAGTIAVAIPNAKHTELDWFHLPKAKVTLHDRIKLTRLREELLVPFTNGAGNFEFKRYNWGYLAGIEDGYPPEAIQLSNVDMIILEGCGALHPLLKPLYHLTVWLDTDAQEALRRGTSRDFHEYGLDPLTVERAWAAWNHWEEDSLRAFDRKQLADIIA